ncbi:MAG: RNA pseudouridine synthase [Saprospiraceae bacterium]|nr:RNA pseudouridine synthase [Saprospiraceae bacterium]
MTTPSVADMLVQEDAHFLFLNKPAGLAVQSSSQPDLVGLATAYANLPCHPCHRIDQPCTGLVVLAKNAEAAASFQRQLQMGAVTRKYLAAVANVPTPPVGDLIHRLQKSHKSNKMLIRSKGKEARLSYRLLSSSTHYHLLEIQLASGRQHQIRAQLAAIGCPIKGDNKYGFKRKNRDRSIHLHSHVMHFDLNDRAYQCIAPLPHDPLWQFFAQSL